MTEPWTPSEKELALFDRLEASDDPLDNAYAEVYRNRCFVTEFGGGEKAFAAVGELDALKAAEEKLGKQLDPQQLTMGEAFSLNCWPCTAGTREESVRGALELALQARENVATSE